ncbi:MAG: 30S ribosomal protein S3 [Chloroflexi bacterium]|nr:30S ribosomal protein S3 [Chloroflexota bacterium]
MGHKTHPVGFRLGVIKDWQSRWFAGNRKEYSANVIEDWRIRDVIKTRYAEAGISRIDIERSAQDITVNVHTARPGIVIGRGGQRVDELRKAVEGASGVSRVRLNVLEIRQPELDALLVARNVAEQLERRVMFRRAMKQAQMRSMQAGAKGIKILVSGRLGGAEIARNEKTMDGQVPLHTLRADIDYGLAEAHTTMGRIGIKVWIYKGQVLDDSEKARLVEPLPEVPIEAIAAAEEALASQEYNVVLDEDTGELQVEEQAVDLNPEGEMVETDEGGTDAPA